MLIKRLEVKGFKSLRDVVWEPGPLTVVIGPNGSGKTNLLYALELIKQSTQGTLNNFIQQLGGLRSIYWGGENQKVSIDISIDIDRFTYFSNTQKMTYHLEINTDYLFNDYSIDNESVDIYESKSSNSSTRILSSNKNEKFILLNSSEQLLYNTTDQNFNKKETLLSKQSSTFQISQNAALSNYYFVAYSIFKDIITSRNSEVRRPQVTKYDKQLSHDIQNLVNVLHTLYSENRNFENNINVAMQAAFGDDFDRLVFPPAADQLVQLRIRWKSLNREQSMFELSDGTIRFLFLMTVLCNPEVTPIIAIDEPETGLHPSMFPIIAEYAAEASKRTQVIFSTHSPQFLDAFSDFDVTTTVTNWCHGETTVKNLDGEALKKWLEHYSLGSLFLSGDLEALA